MVYIQPAPGNAILSVEICNEDGLPVYEASIDGASGEETVVISPLYLLGITYCI